MNGAIPINGQSKPEIEGRHIVISERVPNQWQLESNIPPREVVVILLEIAKMAALKEMKEPPMIAVPEMKVQLQ